MFIKRFFMATVAALGLGACTGGSDWHSEYGSMAAGTPSQMQSSFYGADYGSVGGGYTNVPASSTKSVAVLLPKSGPNAKLGNGIAKSVEMAFAQKKYNNISVKFYDMSGNKIQKQDTVTNALATEPDIIIGPIFAEDAQMVRDMKPGNLPVLSFTSDTNAVGGGVLTMALIPAQSIELIVREMSRDNAKSFVILAPRGASGELMAGAAVESANINDVPVSGVFYYAEGNSDSIKQTAEAASMFAARSAANTRAREILSDILVKESLDASTKISINAQLDKISKSDTLGKAPYDAVLFLGNGSDSKSLASFLRYYDVGARDVQFYGTALWDGPDLVSDITMTGAKYASLPPMSDDFARLYEQLSGNAPSRLDTFGFDAANIAIGMLNSDKIPAAYLLNPSGYRGIDGLFRLRPDGIDERALQINELNAGGSPRVLKPAARDFMTPLYAVQPGRVYRSGEVKLVSDGINPMNYIKIPESLRGKYKSKTYGANMSAPQPVVGTGEIIILPEDDSDPIAATPDFKPVNLEPVNRKLIDSVEMN